MEKGADICLLIEGSYPYVTGGVASWVQWLIENMKEYSFSVVAFTGEEKKQEDMKYPLPENVLSFQQEVLFDYTEIDNSKPLMITRKQWEKLSIQLHRLMNDWKKAELSAEGISFIKELIKEYPTSIFKNFLEDEEAFSLISRLYEDFNRKGGFLKYFYIQRNIHMILYNILMMVPRIPSASIYHSPSTGYSGFIACLRSILYGGNSVITEHGIYLQEREMELLKADWLDEPYLKDMWIEMFSSICKWQYKTCDVLITLSEKNRRLMMDYGADGGRVRVIPNGIKIERYKKARSPRCTGEIPVVGLVGRIDSVKDIKTFIQSIALVKKEIRTLKAYIIGPKEDQPDYYRECIDLVNILNLGNTISFTGRSDVINYYRIMDVLVLSSIKEAMPLVVMEAMCAGLPVVATDVGACMELLYGLDDGIGKAGIIARVMDPESIASGIITILKNKDLANQMAENGIKRIERLYNEEYVIKSYKNLYQELLYGKGNYPS
jgi:glycosyltransferase involved in cell wall biosynthesis